MVAPAVRQRGIFHDFIHLRDIETQNFWIGMSNVDQPSWRCSLGSDVLLVARVGCIAPFEPASKEREAYSAFRLR
jgi:hypothetical protein